VVFALSWHQTSKKCTKTCTNSFA